MTASQQLKKANSYFRDARNSGLLPEHGWRYKDIPHDQQRYILDKHTNLWENEALYKLK